MDRAEYVDFDLLFEKSGEEYIARVLDSPAGQAVSHFTLPFNSLEIENMLLRIGRTRRGVRRLESPEMETARTFGSRLFSAVFCDEILSCLRGSLNESYRLGTGLRLRLRLSSVPELVDLPWEFLYDSTREQFLVLSVETPLVRYLELAQDIDPLPVSPPLKVLVMIASPSDYPPLDVEHEWAKLNEALKDLIQRGLVSLTRLEKATLGELQRQLRRQRYHIFHFIGHGAFDERSQDGVLLTEDELGRGRMVSGDDLGTLLHDHRSLRLAVLNACEGARSSLTDPFAGSAQSLVQKGLPAVIAMQFEITDPAAITLAHEFYSALADGLPVDAALGEARKAIFAQGNDVEWATPVLYLRVASAAVFKIEAPTGPRAAPEEARDQPQAEVGVEIQRLYAQGLNAFWLEDWEQACDSFEAVLKLQPDHREAASRLEAARQNLKLDSLSRQAREAEAAGDWAGAVALLEKLAGQAPADSDAAARLEAARKRKQVQELYTEARQLSQGGSWQAVLNILARISTLDPAFPDPEGLRAAAERGLGLQAKQNEAQTAARQFPTAQVKNPVVETQSSPPALDREKTKDRSKAMMFGMGFILILLLSIIAFQSLRSPRALLPDTADGGQPAQNTQVLAAAASPTVEQAVQPTEHELQPTHTNQPAHTAAPPPTVAVDEEVNLDQLTTVEELEPLLLEANIRISEPEDLERTRSYFYGPESSYHMLAVAVLNIVGDRRFIRPVNLDIVDKWYTAAAGSGYADRGPLDPEIVEHSLIEANNDYYTDNATTLDQLLESRE